LIIEKKKKRAKIKLQVHATNVVTQGLQLKHEKQCADLVQNPDNFPAGNKAVLSGTSKFSHADSKPVETVETARNVISANIGQDPNTMVIGQEVWQVLKNNKSLREMISDSQNKVVTLNHLKEFFEIENIVIGKSIFSGANGAFSRVWGNNVILAYVPTLDSRTEYDPAFAYTVRKKDALQIDEYQKEGNKVKYIRATDIYTPFLVGPEAGYLLSSVV
jgi:hypothetical protein